MIISVSACDWGTIEPKTIQALLTDSSLQIDRYLRFPFQGDIAIVTSSSYGLNHPKTLVRNHPDDAITVLLNARDNYWCQFIYQFAHEYCHILSNYESLIDNPNNWFHESLCELASVFVLKGMAVKWLREPTIPGRESYAEAINTYVRDWMSREETHLSPGETLSEWVIYREPEFRREPLTLEKQRLNQALIAYELLPIFETQPSGWNAITTLPTSESNLKEYLGEWHSNVDGYDKAFVTSISDAFGYQVLAN